MNAYCGYVMAFYTLCMPSLAYCSDLAGQAPFTYVSPGELEPNSGKGVTDKHVYLDAMRFPLQDAPAFLNSQVYRKGGQHAGGSQCDSANYAYPWRDNFCESRDWPVSMCPSGKGHQGQDIRPATCKRSLHWAVAAADGVIAHIGTYSVTLQSSTGSVFRYLHLDMKNLAVRLGDRIHRGDKIGKVSNDFGDTNTTIHLHFDIKDAVIVGNQPTVTFVPPYTSLVNAYEKLLKGAP